jgi:hypothetical protein
MSQLSLKRKREEDGDDKRKHVSMDVRIDEYIDFFKRVKRSPSSSSFDVDEKSLGIWKSNTKQLSMGKRHRKIFDEQQIKKLLSVDPAFFEIRKHVVMNERVMNSRVEKYCDFYLKYNRHPQKKGKIDDESKLADWRFAERLSNKLSETDKKRILEVDPNFYNNLSTVKKQNTIDEYCEFLKVNGRHPKEGNSPAERRLCIWKYNIKYINNLTEKQTSQLLDADPSFFNNKRCNELKVNKYCDFVNTHKIPQKYGFPVEGPLVYWKKCMRNAAKGLGSHTPLNDGQKKKILEVDPTFFKEFDASEKWAESIANLYQQCNK